MLNNCSFIGRITRDPELKYTAGNVPVCSFTIAVDRMGSENGEKKTDFIDCVAWRKTGEIVSQYTKKGSLLCVVGSLQMRDWTDRDGNKRRSAEINVRDVTFCEKKGEASPAPASQGFEELDTTDEGLPF